MFSPYNDRNEVVLSLRVKFGLKIFQQLKSVKMLATLRAVPRHFREQYEYKLFRGQK